VPGRYRTGPTIPLLAIILKFDGYLVIYHLPGIWKSIFSIMSGKYVLILDPQDCSVFLDIW